MASGVRSKLVKFCYKYWVLLLILVSALFVRMINFTSACGFGHLGYGFSFYSNIARNYLKYGFLLTRSGPVTNFGLVDDPSQFIYYLHHSSMVFYLLIGISAKVFGLHEWSMRLVPLIFSMASIWLIYAITRLFWSLRISLIAVFFAAFVPVAAFYGAHLDVMGSLPLFFILLFYYFYVQWRITGINAFYWRMLVVFLIGSQTDWPMYFAPVVSFIHYFLTSKRRELKIWLLPVVCILAFVVHLSYSYYLTGSILGISGYHSSLVDAFMGRAGARVSDGRGSIVSFTFIDWLVRMARYSYTLFTPLLMIFTSLYCISYLIRILKRKILENDHFIIALLFTGLLPIVLVRQGAWLHEYLLIFLMPGVVISSAVLLGRSSKYLSKEIFNTFLVLVFILFSCGSMYVVLSKHNEDFNNKALRLRDVALSINANTQPTDRILLPGGDILMKFYVDRAMKYYIGSVEIFQEASISDYDYFVVYEDIDPDLLDHLVRNYDQTSRNGIIYFDLQK